jgi:hypothetical protein
MQGRATIVGDFGALAVGTRSAVDAAQCQEAVRSGGGVSADLLRTGVEVTDANAAFFDAVNGFAGCIAGIHEVLRRQGLLEGIWCLDPAEGLSPGQSEEIDRVIAYPHPTADVRRSTGPMIRWGRWSRVRSTSSPRLARA